MGGTFVRGLTFRYIAVLVGLATLVVAGNFIISGVIEGQKTGAAEINVAGRQRMYSQKIVLLGMELDRLGEGVRRQRVRSEYLNSIEKMTQAHEALISGNPNEGISPPSQALREVYFGPAATIDKDIKVFFRRALELLEVNEPGSPSRNPDHDHQESFISLIKPELLAALDRAVVLYQHESENKLGFLSKLNDFISLASLVLLILSALTIFAPVAKRLNLQIRNLKKTEASLIKSEQRFRDFTETASDWVWEMDAQLRFTYVSDRAFDFFELNPSDIVGKSRWELLAKTDAQENVEAWDYHRKQLEERQPFSGFQYSLIDREGKQQHLSINGKPIFDESGAFVGYRGTGRDVTGRVQAQLLLHRHDQSLSQAQRLAQIGSWQWQLKTDESVWSDELLRLLQLKPGTFTPTLETISNFLNETDSKKLRQGFRRSLAEPGYQEELEVEVFRPDGSRRIANIVMTTEFDRDGAPVSMLGSLQDITERKNVEELLRQAKEKAEKASKAKSDFLSSMSHELRTPLNAILGFGQVLQMDTEQILNEEQKTCVEQIVKGGQVLLELIDEVLDLAKIEAGKLSLSMEVVDVKTMIDGCETLVSAMASKRSLTIDINGPLGACVLADYTRLRQVVLNLLSNAVKYNRDHGRVSVSWVIEEANTVKLCVSDTGRGIEAEKADGLFEPFNRLGAETQQIEGTGIGLTIAKRLVGAMGGEIGFDTELGVGSTFWIRLPSAELAQLGEGGGQDTARTDFRISSKGAKILYVEDNPANLKLMGMVVKQLGAMDLIAAPNAEMGIDLARSELPDIILMDINLPGMDGFKALDVLKTMVETKDTPVIAVSAAAMKADIKRGMDAGFHAYVSKPIEVGNLLSIIKEMID